MPSRPKTEKACCGGDLLDEQDARQCTEERTAATKDTGAAEHHRRDALQRIVLTNGRIADADLSGQQKPTQCGEA